MKKLIPTIVLIFTFIVMFSQTEPQDVIYPTQYKNLITDCRILELSYDSTVRYIKNDSIQETKAIAISINGVYTRLSARNMIVSNKIWARNNPDFLYKGKSYSYYEQKYRSNSIKFNIGFLSILVGSGFLVGGILSYPKEANTAMHLIFYNESKKNTATVLIATGITAIGIGIPLMTVGIVKRKKCLESMNQFQNNPSLSLALTNNGIGLVISH